MLFGFSDLPLTAVIAIFCLCAAAIGVAGTKLARIADTLASRTGMGEILAGALFVGGSTSLPGALTSAVTAAQDYPGLAIGNAVGGLTAQTSFLALADLAYRKANLEHAAASTTGLAQGTLLVTMLTIPLLAMSAPDFTIWHIHPASILLFVMYGFGLRLLSQIKAEPMWKPVLTKLTPRESLEEEEEEESSQPERSLASLWLSFGVYAVITGVAGLAIGDASIALVTLTGLSETAVGTVFAAIANSLPELVTAIAAVRIGAVNLAVGDIIGGNSFEVLFLAVGDLFYTQGSIYHRFTPENVFTSVLVILMTGILLLGMLRREERGPANIGWESALVLGLYAASLGMVLL